MAASISHDCECAICSLNLDFEIQPHLLQEIERHNCVVFAGAGISTETRLAHPDTFYDSMRAAVGCTDTPAFPELVDRLESQPNGRQKLIQLIVDRFSYINGFRELRGTATRFHQEISTMPYFSTIVTTNWDRYFEDYCGATPFVYESDVPFWGLAKRAVLKIHGSIDNYASIVASTEDYTKCAERLRDGAIGAVLKQLFATKTFVFCGYSASDSDFISIFEAIRSGLGAFARTHYLISPFLTDEQTYRLSHLNIVGIKTDASYFMKTIKQHMIAKYCFASDESYGEIFDTLLSIREEHRTFVSTYKPADHPHLIFATVYQDGLIHAFERILDEQSSGRFSDLHFVQRQIDGYEQMIRRYKTERNYWEVCYFTGYMTALEYFSMIDMMEDSDIDTIPSYFHPGIGYLSREAFDDSVRDFPDIHKGALAQARKILRHSAGAEVIQHLPWAS